MQWSSLLLRADQAITPRNIMFVAHLGISVGKELTNSTICSFFTLSRDDIGRGAFGRNFVLLHRNFLMLMKDCRFGIVDYLAQKQHDLVDQVVIGSSLFASTKLIAESRTS